MNEVDKKIFARLMEGPAVLFLGQNYLKLESDEDPFLSAVIQKYSGPEQEKSYNSLLKSDARNNPESALAWMQARCERFSAPEWLEQVASFAWNHVYTSAIDTIWLRAFQTPWRELQPILDERYRYQNPRNRSRLHCTFLYGRVDRSNEEEQAPLTTRDWYRRNQTALALARRLPEIITPLGTLIIEGYDSSTDWFSLESLLSTIIDELNPGQTHIFSADTNFRKDPYAQELIAENKIILHEESLATTLLEGVQSGLLTIGLAGSDTGIGRRVNIANDIVRNVPRSIWNQVSNSAIVLDDTLIIPPSVVSDDVRYREFRHFLSESSNVPVWQGYARNFAFERDYEEKLAQTVKSKLKATKLHDEPILVRGQTGTGKTVALGHLAFKLRQERNHPILFIGGKNKNPRLSDIDAFCQWVKGEWEAVNKPGTPTTIIFWDANEPDDYNGLLRYLAGRGHRVVLVGSCHKSNVKSVAADKVSHIIEAPVHLSSSEVKKFLAFLNEFEPSLGNQLKERVSDNTFLVALYRLLPPTRPLITLGILKEFDAVEKKLSQLAKDTVEIDEDSAPQFGNTLYYALAKSGLIEERSLLSFEKIRFAGDDVNETQRLFGLVMMPGSLGLHVPFELLLRTLGKGGTRIYSELLGQFDIFHWYEDQTGDITIGPRHTLEARLWSQSNLGGAQFEVEYAKQLLFGIRDTGDTFNNPEVEFAVNLVRHMGPNVGVNGSTRFVPYFKEISDTLNRLREERSIENPRLMLQEANLLREYVSHSSRQGNTPEDVEEMLENAEDILSRAIELMGDDPKQNGAFLGELAALHGTRFRHYLDHTPEESIDPHETLKLFLASREAVFKAWSVDTENYYPVDILSWIAKKYLSMGDSALPTQFRFEVESDILHVFEMAESEEFSLEQEQRFQIRRYEVGNLIGKKDLTDDAFRKLEEQGSAAGYYLRAYYMIGDIAIGQPINDLQKQECQKAADYLEQNREVIKGDGRALYLLLRLWWTSKTGKPIFHEERQTLPFSQKDWAYCFKLISTLLTTNEIYYNPQMSYLSGLALFHLEQFSEAFNTFDDLEREADFRTGSRRIIRSYLASQGDGEPKVYSGQVHAVFQDRKKGMIYVPEIRKNITFFPREFNRPNIQKGDSISEFHIAFNFLGPIADPVSFFKAPK